MKIAPFKLPLLVASLLIAGSCSHFEGEADSLPVVTDYDQVGSHLDRPVRVRGYYGAHHEATGLYFRRSDLRNYDGGGKCVAITNGSFTHGERIELAGTLRRGRCGGDLICLTVCQPFEFTPSGATES